MPNNVYWDIRYHPRIITTLQIYIDMYLGSFLTTYTDTGIWSEDTIRQNAIQKSEDLYTEIRKTLQHTFLRDIIAYTPISTDIRSTTCTLGRRYIVVTYYEDIHTHTRNIETLRIYRK
jgi:hypothetical protein